MSRLFLRLTALRHSVRPGNRWQVERHRPFHPEESQWVRNMVELSILFLMAVILLRGFILEGYLISTGSMAPGLAGLHKHIRCPSCQYEFAFGVTFDDSVPAGSASDPAVDNTRRYAECPNCGQVGISIAAVPVSHGDQLLVHKGAFDFRRPRRWETVVFRNPASPGEAYVKRAVGLPGETIQISDGDLYVEGQIARKDLATQRDMRIGVFDLAHVASSEEWQLPWVMKGDWRVDNGQFVCVHPHHSQHPDDSDGQALPEQTAGPGDVHWLQWRNWRWSGGTHFVEVPLTGKTAETDWQKCLQKMQDRPITWTTHLAWDRERQVLRLQGVMPWQMQRDLTAWADSEEFRNAVYRLGALSHICPVTDRYGYNSSIATPEYPVRDLMLEAEFTWQEPPETLSFRMPIGHHVLRTDLRISDGQAVLISETTGETLRSAALPPIPIDSQSSTGLRVLVSGFDHRLIVAIGDTLLFPELDLPLSAQHSSSEPALPETVPPPERARRAAEIVTQQSRLGLGAKGSVHVSSLRVYRDVYYTPGKRQNGIRSPITVDSNSYFVQGDNSPVSSDSRNWDEPCVPHRLLLGKPFVVHLPSKPGKLEVAGYDLPIRIPDFKRIRYIH